MAVLAKRLGETAFNAGTADLNWFPGQMAASFRAIKERLDLVDYVLEIRDARIPLTSANEDLQEILSRKSRLIILNKMDLANSNLMSKWTQQFEQYKQCCYFVNAHNKDGMKKLLHFLEAQLKEIISKQPTQLLMVVGIPNVGKSAIINSLHQIARHRFPALEKLKRATVGPLPGVTQDIKGFKIGHQPSIFALDTPGVLVPDIPDVETGLKLALTGAIKDSIVGEDRLAQYLLALLNTHAAPLQWKNINIEGFEDLGEPCLEDPSDGALDESIEEVKKRRKEKRRFSDHTQVLKLYAHVLPHSYLFISGTSASDHGEHIIGLP